MLATVFVVGTVVAMAVATVLVPVLAAVVTRATIPMHPSRRTASTARTIQSQALLFFFGGGG